MDWLITAVAGVREAQIEMRSQLRQIVRRQDEIIALLQQQQSKPHLTGPNLDWTKWAPRLWWGLLAAGLVTAKAMDLPEVAAILSRLG